MKDFIFHTPTKVVFGHEAEAKLGGLLTYFGKLGRIQAILIPT